MEKHTARRIGECLKAVTAVTGLPVLWRGLENPPSPEVLEEPQFLHCNSFCMAVKARECRYAQCRPRESTDLIAEVLQKREPYPKRCHAGVVEWVVPLLSRGRYEGALLLGPFRPVRGRCAYTDLAAEFRRLPRFSTETVAQLQPVFDLLADYIVDARQRTVTLRAEQVRDARALAAAAYIEEHFAVPFQLAVLARHCALSASRLVHLFRREYGVAMTTYLAQVRVREAQRFLASTDKTLSEIAVEVGLVDQSYFGAVFKRHTDLTPRRYRIEERRKLAP